MLYSHLNEMEIPETKRFIPEGFELGTTFGQPNRSIPGCNQFTMQISFATPNFNLELIKTSEVKTDFFLFQPLERIFLRPSGDALEYGDQRPQFLSVKEM